MGAQGSWHASGPILYDEKGKPYRNTQFIDGTERGIRDYLPPRSMDPYGPSGAPEGSLFRQSGEWDSQSGEWDQPINWSNIASMGIGGAMAGPALAALFAGGGGGAAGAGSALLSEGATGAGLSAAGMTPGLIGGASAAGGLGAAGGASALLSEGAAGAGLPTSGMTQGLIGGGMAAGGGASGFAGGAGNAASAAGGGLTNKLVGAGVTAGLGALGSAGGGGGNIPPELQQILDLQKQRMQMQNPLFEAISRLAMSRLPTAQQQPMPGGTGTDPFAALQRLGGR